jgi:hypothetical protein
LLALPHVGTGQGGKRTKSGHVLEKLVPFLQETAINKHIDIALVAYEQSNYHAAQAIRKRLCYRKGIMGIDASFPGITEELKQTAIRLSTFARNGELVLFIGAGVSASAGLPLWGDLLLRIAHQVCSSTLF